VKKSIWVIVIILTLVLIGGAFYWWQVRPSQIRKECAKKNSTNNGLIKDIEKNLKKYEGCLHEKGLK